MGCQHCTRTYSIKRPECRCEGCVTAGRSYCISCCYAIFPGDLHERIHISGRLLCYTCLGRNTEPGVISQPCSCCPQSVLCQYCCLHHGHMCCAGVPIRFRNNPLRFLYPCLTQDAYKRLVGWTTRDLSEVLFDNKIANRINPKGFKLNASQRFAAVELEFLDHKNARELNNILQKWNCSVVEDGSIVREFLRLNPNYPTRRNLRSFEINTTPACGDVLYQQLFEICEGLETAKAITALSCGIHVHVDCRDFGYQELQRLIKAYCYIEDALFAAVHPSRYNNEFCTPCGNTFYDRFIRGIKPDTKGLKKSLISGVYGDEAVIPRTGPYDSRTTVNYHSRRAEHYGRLHHGERNPLRYSALNLHSYFLRGTVESRTHHGSTSFDEIWGWTKLLIEVFDSISKLSDQKLDTILAISAEELKGVYDLFDTAHFKRLDLLHSSVGRGVIVLRSLLSNSSFQELLNKIKLSCVAEDYTTLPCQRKTMEV